MAPTSRPEHHINLNYIPQLSQPPHSGSSTGNTSPVEPPNSGSLRFSQNTSNPLGNTAAGARLGNGSPSHEYGGRLFSKRFVTL
jgi:protein JSN1